MLKDRDGEVLSLDLSVSSPAMHPDTGRPFFEAAIVIEQWGMGAYVVRSMLNERERARKKKRGGRGWRFWLRSLWTLHAP